VGRNWAQSVSSPMGRPSLAQSSKVQKKSSDCVYFGLVSLWTKMGYVGS
jgi:hypothetical protein